MKRKLGLLLLFTLVISALQAQTNKATISYDLKRTFTANNASVGGDLVITRETPLSVPVCTPENQTTQTIYNGKSLANAFLNVDNSTGLGCVTITVSSNVGSTKQTIPAGGVSGVLSFSNVQKVIITIDQKTNDVFPETVTAKGNVDFWF